MEQVVKLVASPERQPAVIMGRRKQQFFKGPHWLWPQGAMVFGAYRAKQAGTAVHCLLDLFLPLACCVWEVG
jgi:hypothetical protein